MALQIRGDANDARITTKAGDPVVEENVKRLKLDQRGHQRRYLLGVRKLQHQDQKAAHEDRFCSGNRGGARRSRRSRGWRERHARPRTSDVEQGRRSDGVNGQDSSERGEV